MLTDHDTDVDAIVEDRIDADDHYLLHVAPDEYNVKIRHDGRVHTTVEDGVVVHKVFESVDDDAHGDSVGFAKGRYTCPLHGADATESDRTVDDDTDQITIRYHCTTDGCPFYAAAGQRHAEYGTPDHKRPLWFRATVPHDTDSENFDVDRFQSLVDSADHNDTPDVVGVSNVLRKLHLSGYTNQIRDSAYVSAEYDGDPYEDDDAEKIADAYIDTFDCGACGRTVDAGVEVNHPHFGDVCPDCEDATVWSVDDADVPDDVRARMADHATFDADNIVALLRDVIHWPNYFAKASADDDGGLFADDDDVTPADVGPIKTGSQGKRNMGDGNYKMGTGLRRSRDGVFNGMTHWRTLLSDAVDTGLISRADDRDVGDEDANASWVATDKGRRVFDSLARCRTCGASKKPYMNKSTYSAGNRHETSKSLVLRCPGCDDLQHGTTGDSSTSACVRLPGVDYSDD